MAAPLAWVVLEALLATAASARDTFDHDTRHALDGALYALERWRHDREAVSRPRRGDLAS